MLRAVQRGELTEAVLRKRLGEAVTRSDRDTQLQQAASTGLDKLPSERVSLRPLSVALAAELRAEAVHEHAVMKMRLLPGVLQRQSTSP